MNELQKYQIKEAKQAALDVLLNNAHGPYMALPRTAGWGYPEPYTRDLMIAYMGVAASENIKLNEVYRRVLETLAKNQTEHGHMPSLVHDRGDVGASDTTPLFLMAVGIYRQVTGEKDFLHDAVEKALCWMQYQSPSDRRMIAQLPTSDWRDEQWVLGFGLFVNTVAYAYLQLLGYPHRAELMRKEMTRFTITGGVKHRHVHEGMAVTHKPYYALWSYKIFSSERFDLLGNSLAILTGIAPPRRAGNIISWIEDECAAMIENGELAVAMPPNFFPYIKPQDPDWMPRYEKFNNPGDYHNGGIWPFVCGFYIAALVAAGKQKLAEKKLVVLTELIKKSRDETLDFGFNEWIKAQTGAPMGQDWQTWSAAMYFYAATCVEQKRTPFFDLIRDGEGSEEES